MPDGMLLNWKEGQRGLTEKVVLEQTAEGGKRVNKARKSMSDKGDSRGKTLRRECAWHDA